MTKEEAKQIIATWLVSSKGAKGQRGYIEGWFDEEDAEAFRMAIEALSADKPKGEWIDKGEYAKCSICGAHSGTQFDGVEPIPLKSNFCPNCGARMKGGAE